MSAPGALDFFLALGFIFLDLPRCDLPNRLRPELGLQFPHGSNIPAIGRRLLIRLRPLAIFYGACILTWYGLYFFPLKAFQFLNLKQFTIEKFSLFPGNVKLCGSYSRGGGLS